MSKTFKGYDLFAEVEDDLVQAWNRAQMVANINQDIGPDSAQEYAEYFSPVEKMKVEMLLAMVSFSGKEEVQKRIMKTLAETQDV